MEEIKFFAQNTSLILQQHFDTFIVILYSENIQSIEYNIIYGSVHVQERCDAYMIPSKFYQFNLSLNTCSKFFSSFLYLEDILQ